MKHYDVLTLRWFGGYPTTFDVEPNKSKVTAVDINLEKCMKLGI
jgi:hypothetical protein